MALEVCSSPRFPGSRPEPTKNRRVVIHYIPNDPPKEYRDCMPPIEGGTSWPCAFQKIVWPCDLRRDIGKTLAGALKKAAKDLIGSRAINTLGSNLRPLRTLAAPLVPNYKLRTAPSKPSLTQSSVSPSSEANQHERIKSAQHWDILQETFRKRRFVSRPMRSVTLSSNSRK